MQNSTQAQGTNGNIYGNVGNYNTSVNSPNQPTSQYGSGNFGNENYYANQQFIGQQGQNINNETAAQQGYYGSLIPGYQQQEDTALNNLNQNPGYTPSQTGQINVNYGQFNTSPQALQSEYLSPTEQQDIYGNPAAAEQVINQGVAGEGAMLNQYQANLGGTLGAYQQNLGGQVQNLDTGLGGATQALGQGLQQAQSGDSAITAAASNPNLAFDPNHTENQLSNQDVQNLVTSAGTTVGNQYQAAENQLTQNAAAAGNTSPLALAAANARLENQSAANAGDAMTNAQIAAEQAQYQQAAGIEGQREGAAQAQAGLGLQAGTFEQQQAQNAAALAGEAGIGSAETAGLAGINAANTYGSQALNTANNYGQTSIGTQENIANQQYGAANEADILGTQRAQNIADNRQNIDTGINQTQYGQGVGSAGLTASGAANVGQTQIAGENAYRQGLAGQEGFAQTGGNQALQEQLANYLGEGQLLNQSTSNEGSYINQSPTFAGQFGQIMSGLGSFFTGGAAATNAYNNLAKGGMVTEPTVARIGESGPEKVSSMTAPYSSHVVDTPTTALLGDKGPEKITPLNDQPGNRVSGGVLGQGGMRTRFRRVTGPNAMGRKKPIQADLPLRPNIAAR